MTAVRVHIDHANKRLYWRELFYASECKVSALTPVLKDYPSDYVFCDHNPAHIMELVDADINAYRANKKIQLEERVKILRQYDLYIHEDS